METPNGTKRIIAIIIMALPYVLAPFGYAPSEVAPIEIARFADSVVQIVGMILLLWGEYSAKAPLWFAKVNKK